MVPRVRVLLARTWDPLPRVKGQTGGRRGGGASATGPTRGESVTHSRTHPVKSAKSLLPSISQVAPYQGTVHHLIDHYEVDSSSCNGCIHRQDVLQFL